MKTYLIAGRTGVGKSSFVNNTFGIRLAETSPLRACTKVVEYHSRTTPFGPVALIDTPGLAEDDEDLDIAYLKLVSERLKSTHIDSMIYVTTLKDNRTLRTEEKTALRLLTEHLGGRIWEPSWLVLTFAASVSSSDRWSHAKHVRSTLESYLTGLTGLGTNRTGRYREMQFERMLLTDNVVSGWSDNCRPTAEFLT